MGQTLSEPVTAKNTTTNKNKNIIYAESCMQGWRLTMEDAHVCEMNLQQLIRGGEEGEANGGLKVDGGSGLSGTSLFCVFDGHGGTKVAKYASDNIAQILVKQKSFSEGQFREALSETYFLLDENMRKLVPSIIDDNSGATAVSCLIVNNKIFCANSGDSRCIISVNGEAVPMSQDHKPSLQEEHDRIRAAGGFVEFGRVNGNLALSRALGDFDFKNNPQVSAAAQVVSVKPDISEHDINNDVLFCVLACDGIWDCMTNQEVVDFIQSRIVEKKSLGTICEEIIDFCLAPDAFLGAVGCDNMSIIIIGFLNGGSEEEWVARCEKTLQKNPSTTNGNNTTNEINGDVVKIEEIQTDEVLTSQ